MNKKVVINPEWIDVARLQNKKNYNLFLNMLADVITYGEIPNTYDKESKAYKIFKAMRIEDDIFNQYVDKLLDKPIDTGLVEKAKASYTK